MNNLQLPPTLLNALRSLITQARQQATRSVNTLQVQTYWQIGRHIVEFEQGGEARAAYGKRLLPQLATVLTAEFGKGFDERNLRNMRAFFQHFPNWNAVRSELSWTHTESAKHRERSPTDYSSGRRDACATGFCAQYPVARASCPPPGSAFAFCVHTIRIQYHYRLLLRVDTLEARLWHTSGRPLKRLVGH